MWSHRCKTSKSMLFDPKRDSSDLELHSIFPSGHLQLMNAVILLLLLKKFPDFEYIRSCAFVRYTPPTAVIFQLPNKLIENNCIYIIKLSVAVFLWLIEFLSCFLVQKIISMIQVCGFSKNKNVDFSGKLFLYSLSSLLPLFTIKHAFPA